MPLSLLSLGGRRVVRTPLGEHTICHGQKPPRHRYLGDVGLFGLVRFQPLVELPPSGVLAGGRYGRFYARPAQPFVALLGDAPMTEIGPAAVGRGP